MGKSNNKIISKKMSDKKFLWTILVFGLFCSEKTIARQIRGHNNALPQLRERTFNRLFPAVAAAKSNQAPLPPPPQYINSYMPPLMQALHYFTEMLTYEISEMTTIEPPFNLSTVAGDTVATNPKPTVPMTMLTNPSTWWTTTTKRTTTPKPQQDVEISTQKPATTQTWWKPPETTMPVTWWKPPTTIRTTTRKTTWWNGPRPPTTMIPKPSEVTTTSPWWVPPSTTPRTTTKRPPITTTTTRRQQQTTTPWWAKPTTTRTTTTRPTTRTTTTRKTVTSWSSTTQSHFPGVYMPERPWYLGPAPTSNAKPSSSINNNYIVSDSIVIRPASGQKTTTKKPKDEFFSWFFQSKPKKTKYEFEYNMNLLDPFPKKLLEDIAKEKDHLPAIMDEDNVDEFRKIYDDSWAFRYKPLTGKKKTPPTKPYVEMLLLYDLLKKDAKRLAFNKYNGYSEDLLRELHQLAKRSSERQLHTLLTKVLEQNEYEGTRTKSRIEGLITDLGNPYSVISKTLRYIPPLSFLI